MDQLNSHLVWYDYHIPHRLRAAMAQTNLLNELLQKKFNIPVAQGAGVAVAVGNDLNSVRWHCISNAVWEGRLSAARWLIDFLGICCNKNGKPDRPGSRSHDFRIDALGGNLFPKEHSNSQLLADIWLGCTKASSHPTDNSRHPSVDPLMLDAAIRIIYDYLGENLYKPKGLNIIDHVMICLGAHPQHQGSK